MSVEEIIIKKIMRGDILGDYSIECSAIRDHIKQLEERIKEFETLIEEDGYDTALEDAVRKIDELEAENAEYKQFIHCLKEKLEKENKQ